MQEVILMKWNSTIVEVGADAIDPQSHTAVLFGQDASPSLARISVLQRFDDDTAGFVFKKGDSITIDGQTYIASFVGPLVETNIKALGHATLMFMSKPKKPMANAIYLDVAQNDPMPKFAVGGDLMYEHN